MVKRINKLVLCVLSVMLSLILLLPNFNSKNAVSAETENQEVKHSLISPEYNRFPDQTLNKYNISSTSSFTPFDFDEGERRAGMSFRLESGEDNKIENKFVYVDDYDVAQGLDYSLFLWIYFDTAYVHNLTITLELENNSSIKWDIAYGDLQDMLRKTSDLNYVDFPFGWNKFELPFKSAQINGKIYDGGKLVQTSKMIVNFSSSRDLSSLTNVGSAEKSFSLLRFYDVYLAESDNSTKKCPIKQAYRFCSFNFFDDEVKESVCVGDSLYIPILSKAINYAWNGEEDVKNTLASSNTIVWSVVIQTPNLNDEYIRNISFGQKLTFEYEGTYKIYYQCTDTRYSNTEPIISGSQTIFVSKLKPIYFNRNSFNFEVGKSYIIKAETSSKFSHVSDLEFTSSSENVIVENLGNGYFKITPNKKGDYSVDVSVEGQRAASPVNKTYTVTIDVSVKEAKVDNTHIYKIVLWSIVGVGVVILLIFGIKIIVKAHKYDVK